MNDYAKWKYDMRVAIYAAEFVRLAGEHDRRIFGKPTSEEVRFWSRSAANLADIWERNDKP